jgi:hypothetical protein
LNIETEAIISLLKLTREGPVSHERIKQEARMPSSTIMDLLWKLQNDGLINGQGILIEVDSLNRLKLAVQAVQAGADLERVSKLLRWQEFEGIAAYGFERNGYHVFRNVYFKQGERRYEMDIVALQGQLVVCADCKHWKRGLTPSVLNKVAEEQAQRTSAFTEALPSPKIRIDFAPKVPTTFVPAILTLIPASSKFYDDIPVVPVLQLQGFLNELPCHMHSLKHYRKRIESFKALR